MISETHKARLLECSKTFDRAPFNLIGDGLPVIAIKIYSGNYDAYTLDIDLNAIDTRGTLLNTIESFSNGRTLGAIWQDLPDTLDEKIKARRRIDYYKLNFIERIKLIDSDPYLGDSNGVEIESEILTLFPELAFQQTDEHLKITIHLPHTY